MTIHYNMFLNIFDTINTGIKINNFPPETGIIIFSHWHHWWGANKLHMELIDTQKFWILIILGISRACFGTESYLFCPLYIIDWLTR